MPLPAQAICSAATSLNQVAATFKQIPFLSGALNLDYGGGRYDKATHFLAEQGVTNLVYDPFNRSIHENLRTRLIVSLAGGTNTVTVNNVLNVIGEEASQDNAIRQAANGCKPEGEAWFLLHEGDKSGQGAATSKGWQRNQRAQDYLPGILRWFGSAKRTGTIIRASQPVQTPDSLFCREQVASDLLAACKKAGVPQRSARFGVGKWIGGNLYVHRAYIGVLPQDELARALSCVPPDFDWTVAKWHEKTGAFSFIESPDFDTADEPTVGAALRVAGDGRLSLTPQKADPQIYHHKFNFVGPDYAGFDCAESMLRSLSWADSGADRSRIGTRSYWFRSRP